MSELAVGATALALIAAYVLGRRVGRGEGFAAGLWVAEDEVKAAQPEVKYAKASMDPEHLAVQRRRAGLQ
jgi:hypothetical protein